MNAYRLEVLIIDHDEIGSDEIVAVLEGARYPNRCISPDVKRVDCVDIGDWHDDHPLNGPGDGWYLGMPWSKPE